MCAFDVYQDSSRLSEKSRGKNTDGCKLREDENPEVTALLSVWDIPPPINHHNERDHEHWIFQHVLPRSMIEHLKDTENILRVAVNRTDATDKPSTQYSSSNSSLETSGISPRGLRNQQRTASTNHTGSYDKPSGSNISADPIRPVSHTEDVDESDGDDEGPPPLE